MNSQRKTTEEFIVDARRVHGDKYDYSKVIYVRNGDKVEIVCPKHGSFMQVASSHLSGCGCPKCANELHSIQRNKYTQEDFIKAARKKHGDKYDYTQVHYVDTRTKVTIICPKHGPFTQAPYVHLKGEKGCGCRQCMTEINSGKRRLTIQEFINRSIKTHDIQYDYSRVKYVNNLTPVEIICPKHGAFMQTPAEHMMGANCPRCVGNVVTQDDYIQHASKQHHNKYDYSITVYRGNKEPIEYICPKHGVIKQVAGTHLVSGCPYCANNVAIDKERFIEMVNEKFGNKFDLSGIDYKGFKGHKIIITCPVHGPFEMTPASFIRSKYGCPKCCIEGRADKFRLSRDEFVQRSSEVHNYKYDYSLIRDDMKMDEPVKIICPDHGVFIIKPTVHLHTKVGCPKCRGRQMTVKDFIRDATKIHGKRYDYSLVEFKKYTDKVKIICPKHGIFTQRANIHARVGMGCPKCSESHLERKVQLALEKRKIKYIYQKPFDWLRFKGKQYLDFYLPKYNVAIECQGVQHFVADFRDGGQEGLALRQKMDENKYNLCKKHGIRILYHCTKAPFLLDDYFDKIYLTITELMDEIRKYDK